MKKILLSLAVIVAVGGVVWGVTGAFYNDTETSNGNIFVAGSIDLKVDHTKQTYNGVDCKTCSVVVVSDTSNMVTAGTSGEGDPVAFPHTAQLVTFIHPAWTADVDGGVNDAKWIWATDPVVVSDVTNDVAYTFEKTFTWMGPISGATLNMGVASDNGYEVYLNNVFVGSDLSESNYNLAGQDSYSGGVISVNITQGTNTLKFVVKNKAAPGSTPSGNPAGLLYKLTINGNCGSAYFQNHCSLWQETDLTVQSFFKFDDVKPGDFGTNVISLHVYDNDAYACLIVGNKDDQENPVQPLGPELAANDALNVGNPSGFGELSNFLNVFTWGDTDGDGIYDNGETTLGSGPLSTLTSIMSMDSLNQQFLVATTTKNIGLAWCAGTLTPNQGGSFGCNGGGMGNIAQSDSFTASLTAYAEQVRNNGSFVCSGVSLPVQP